MKKKIYRVSIHISRSATTINEKVENVRITEEGEHYYHVENKHYPNNDITVRKEELNKVNTVYNPLYMEVWVWTDNLDNAEELKKQLSNKAMDTLTSQQKIIDEYKALLY